MHFSPFYLLNLKYLMFVAPALILAAIAQMWIRSAYAKGQAIATDISGFFAARKILDAAGLSDVPIEEVAGQLTDHYDPKAKVLRLSSDNYHGRNLAAVGVAAHESGHALQDATGYVLMTVRNLAVPVANFGSGSS